MAAKPKYSYLPILKLARKLSPVWPSGIQAAATITFPYIAEETFDTDGQEDFVSMFIAKVLFFSHDSKQKHQRSPGETRIISTKKFVIFDIFKYLWYNYIQKVKTF